MKVNQPGTPMMLKKLPQLNAEQWNSAIASLPGAHILQTWEWGNVKSQFGWQPHYLMWFQGDDKIECVTSRHLEFIKSKPLLAAALVLNRKIMVGGLSHRMGVMYVPKGPMLEWGNQQLRSTVLRDLKQFAEKQSAIFIKVDPDVETGIGVPGEAGTSESPVGQAVIEELKVQGWLFSEEQIQFRNTLLLDLQPNADDLLANMKQKTRYNINLAIRKGVTVRLGQREDIEMLFRMYAETSIRDGFVIRNQAYYREVWSAFINKPGTQSFEAPGGEILIAELDDEAIAAVIIFRFARRGWYLYGMSTQAHRDKMPNYLLQWEAIKRLKAANCITYDLWGAPDEFNESDPLWGVYRFKEGLGGKVYRFMGAWDLPINRMFYRLYSKTLPGLLDLMRRQGKASTKQVIGS